MGRPSDPEYWKKYRQTHPEYMERERERSRNRVRTTEERRVERQRMQERQDAKERKRKSVNKASKAWKSRNPEWVKEWLRNRYLRKAEEFKYKQRLRNKIQTGVRYMEMADEVLASIGVRRDNRVLYDDGLYDDAKGAAVLAIAELKGHKASRQRAAAKQAAQNVLAQYKAQRYTTYSLDQPIPGTDGLRWEDTLEGDWF